MFNHWTDKDKADIERLAFGIEPKCWTCDAPLPKHYDLDQHNCKSCREKSAVSKG